MASFTDDIPQFIPYVSQQPTEAMAQVGMSRETDFNSGIQTVQSYYNNLLGLPIAKREVQEYVKNKVGQLNDAVKQSISGDFSDRRLTNQIGGLASQIAADPIVENGVKSTAALQSGMAKMKADEELNSKNGRHPTTNINDFNDRVSEWLSDGKVDSKFSGDYTPFVDVTGEVVKLYKEQNPSEDLSRDALRYNAKGEIEVNPTLVKGISPSRIQSAIDLVFSRGDVQAQLQVDGRQTYKGVTPEALGNMLQHNTNETLASIEHSVNKLQIEKTTNANSNVNQINERIQDLKNQADRIKKSYKEDTSLLVSNPDAFKTQLVKQNLSQNFINTYTTEVIEENPLFNQSMKLKDFALRSQDNDLREREFAEKKRMDDVTISKETLELQMKQAKAEADAKASGLPYIATDDIVNSSLGEKTEVTARQHLTDLKTSYDREFWNQANILARAAGLAEPAKEVNGQFVPNVDGYKNELAAKMMATQILMMAGTGYLNGQPSIIARDSVDKLSKIADDISSNENAIKKIDDKYAPDVEKIKATIPNPDYASYYVIQRQLPGWENEQSNLIKKYGKDYYYAMGLNTVEGAEDYRKSVKNAGSLNLDFLNQRAADFKDIQGVYNDRAVQLTYGKKEEEEKIKQKFQNIVRMSKLGNSSKRANELQTAMDVQLDKDQNDKYYYTSFDKATGKGYIEVQVHGKPYRIENIPEKDYYQVFPELQTDNSFDYQFGSRLSLTNWRSTDDPSNPKGRLTAYNLETPPNSDYSVQYHLVQGAENGKYNLRVWIQNKKTGKMIDGGEGGGIFAITGSDFQTTNLDRAGIMSLLDKLKDPNFLKAYDTYLNPAK